jgi:hypothetical protein
MLVTSGSGADEHSDLLPDPDAACPEDAAPIGCGRFLFRLSALDPRIRTALPYLDAFAMHLLFGTAKSAPSRRCTIVSAAQDRTAEPDSIVPADLEREILIDISPEVFRRKPQPPNREPDPPQPASLLLAALTPEEKTKLAVELAHAVPFPVVIKKLAFAAYRLWFRFHSTFFRRSGTPAKQE